MNDANWTTRWEVLREMMGAPNSRRRKAVLDFLQSRPCLMYWGDSWFSTPLYLNLAKQSMLRIDGMAMLVGKPGATAAGLFTASQIRNYADRLKSNPFDALCLSAGGNDAYATQLFYRDLPSGPITALPVSAPVEQHCSPCEPTTARVADPVDVPDSGWVRS